MKGSRFLAHLLDRLAPLQTRGVAYWSQLSLRDKRLLALIAVVLVLYAVMSVSDAVRDMSAEREAKISRRMSDLRQLTQLAGRFQQRERQLTAMQQTFERSQMTFEQVTTDLDNIVRQSIGSDNYDLKRSETGSSIGIHFEKQDFTLRIRTLNLNQLIGLLYRLEVGKTPLFLGKVDIIRSPRPDDFSATLEVFSIRRKG